MIGRDQLQLHVIIIISWLILCNAIGLNYIVIDYNYIATIFFTRGQFWPSGIVVACVYVCVRASVNHEFVRAISHQPFKLGSPNWDQRCKIPCLRALLFCGMVDRDLQGQIEPQNKNLSHFEPVHAITHHQLKLQFPNLEQKCILALFSFLPILGLIEIDLQFNL